jgi:predicted P-loop ATPase
MLFFPYLCGDIIFIVIEEEKPKKKRKQKTVDGSKERKANWKEYTASVEDIKAFLSDHVYLRHNVITRRVECRLPSNYEHDGTDWQPVTDRIVNSLWAELSKEKPARVQDVYRVIESDFVPEYHPFRFYLEHLPPWDGENHILAMSLSVSVRGDVDTQMRFAEYLTKWLVGMVAGWVDDAVVNNVILVLIGEQGSYKTTWFNYLLPPELRSYFYTKTNANRMGRDDLLTLAQYGLVCCEELDTMRPSELNQLKAAVTMPSIDERAAYAHYHEHRKHIASFCGTGNNAQFLSDPTGNRRWLPFEVESIESPRDHPFDYEAIYAQAYALYQEGFQYWFSREEIAKLSAHNRHFETPRLEYELASLYFAHPTGAKPGEFMSVARAMQIVSANISQKLSAVYLGRALGELGFQRVKYNGVRGYVVVCRSGDEIHAAQQSMAMQAEQESGSVDSSGQYF